MRFARDVSSRIFYMDEGIVYEEGPAKELFENPSKTKTRAFLRRIGMFNSTLNKADFDLYHFMGLFTEFAEKQMLDAKQIKTLHLVLEELLVNIIFPEIELAELEIGISEETKQSELRITWHGSAGNPLESASEAGELARMIVKKRTSSSEYSVLENGVNQLFIKF